MRFVNQRNFWRVRNIIFPLIRLAWSPNFSGKILGFGILYDIICIRRNTPSVATVPINSKFVFLTMFDHTNREFAIPLTIFCPLQGKFIKLLPIRKIANQENLGSIWCPFTKNPSILRQMQAKMLKTKRKRRQTYAS